MNTPNATLARLFRALIGSSRTHSRSGATLLELAVCVLIIGLITIASLDFRKQVSKAKVASAATTARAINDIAQYIYNTTGSWPADCERGVCPPEMSTHLQGSLFSNETPMGGQWDWNGPGGATGDSPGIAIRFKSSSDVDRSLLKKLDSLIDDGDLSGGECVWMATSGGAFYMMGANGSPSMKTESLPSMKAESVETFGLPIKMKEMTMSEAARISSEDLVK